MSIGRLVAGVDSSTQATKVVVVDPDSGQLVAQGHARHTVDRHGRGPRDRTRANGGRRFDGARRDRSGRARSARSRSPVSSTGWSSSTATASPLRKASLWNDTRAAEDAERLTEPPRGGDLGAPDRAPAGRFVHRLQVGLATANRAGPRPGGRRDPAPARLPDRAADRARHDRPGRRLRHRLVVAVGRASTWTRSCACPRSTCRPSCCRRSWARRRWRARSRPRGRGRARAGARNDRRAGHRRQHGRGARPRAVRRPGGHEPGHVRHDLRGVRAPGGRPERHRGRLRRRDRALPAARGDAELHASRSIASRPGSGSIATTSQPAGDRWSCSPTSTASERPTCPSASGTISGLRHTTTPQQILMAAYEGAVASLLVAFDAIDEAVGGLDPAAPLHAGRRRRPWARPGGRSCAG